MYRDSPDGLGCMARMPLLGALDNPRHPRKPVKATDGAAQRSLGKASPLRAGIGTYLWDRGRTSPVGLLLTLESPLMPGTAAAAFRISSQTLVSASLQMSGLFSQTGMVVILETGPRFAITRLLKAAAANCCANGRIIGIGTGSVCLA